MAKFQIQHIPYIRYFFGENSSCSPLAVLVEIVVFLRMVYMTFASSLFSKIFKNLFRSSFLITFLCLLHFLKYCMWTVFTTLEVLMILLRFPGVDSFARFPKFGDVDGFVCFSKFGGFDGFDCFPNFGGVDGFASFS